MANIPFLNNAYFSAKVGIGTDSPGYKLDVSSGSAVGARISTTGFTNLDLVSNRTSGNLGGLRFKQDIDTYQAGEFLGLHGGGFDWKVGDGIASPGIKMRLDSSGNLGIGTTNPETKLTIENASAGPASSTYATTASNSNLHLSAVGVPFYNHLFMGIGSATYAWIQAQHGNSNAQNLALNPIGGNVGIGTDSPDAKLELSSAQPRIRLTDTITGISSGSTTGAIDFYTSDASSEGNAVNAKIESYADSIYGRLGLRFFTGGGGAPTQAMTINWVGSVGIGTAGPSSKLQVDGGIQMADDTATASATKVGTMRYRTATDEPVPVTGTDLVTNGDFATDTGWTKQNSGSTISGGKLNQASVPNGQNVFQTPPLTVGLIYSATFTISNYTAGGVRVLIGSTGATTTKSSNGTFTVTATAAGNTTLYIQAIGTTTLSVDNISVLEVTEEDASYADMCMQTGASTYEWVNIVRNTY